MFGHIHSNGGNIKKWKHGCLSGEIAGGYFFCIFFCIFQIFHNKKMALLG